MSRYTCWLAGIAVAAGSLSASADIQVPPGFVVDTLLDQIDGTTPRLEAIRNSDYGFGVVAASVDDGVLTILRISQSSVELLATTSGLPDSSRIRTIRFDTTGLMASELYVTVGIDTGCSPPGPWRTKLLQVSADGTITERGSLGNCDNGLDLAFDFTDGSSGYSPGAYLEDHNGNDGTALYHMDPEYSFVLLDDDLLPSGRTDLDVKGMEFDPTGLYGSYLTMADSDRSNDNQTAIYQLLPDLTWLELTVPVTTEERFYKDMAFSPGGGFGQLLYATDCVTDTVMMIDPNGQHDVFASGFHFPGDGPDCHPSPDGSITVSDDGEHMFVADSNGIYRIREVTTEVGPTLVMREPWVEDDDVHTGPAGVDSLRLLWSEPVLFDNEDVSITNEDAEPVPFSVSGSNSQFMIIAFGEVLLNDEYTITIHDTVISAETGAAIDGDNDGLAGGDAVLTMEHRNPFDHDRDGDVDLEDFALFQQQFTGPHP